jgi:uncharacterized membrane protein YidH (DUF202 family)
MAISGSGLQDSGLDRALQLALDAELDDELLSGELWPGERAEFPDPIPAVAEVRRRWQRPVDEHRDPPASESSLWSMFLAEVRHRLRRPGSDPKVADPKKKDLTDRQIDAVPAKPEAGYNDARDRATVRKLEKKRYFRWKPERVGIVMIHGIGPHLAGQTLLDWTRPIITLLSDAAAGDSNLEVPTSGARDIRDPVAKANIDFSGETFPVIHVRVPRRKDVPATDPRGQDRTWIFTEAWWASEIRPPTLPTMISWLGEQGGVGRIVQGIQENMVGSGPIERLVGRISLQPIVSVVTSFVLLLFVVLLGISRIIPFGPLRNAVVLSLASSFLTDWFGGARVLLRDAGQSANVRHRLAMTIKALRAYGCRDVVIVAHSGGTMASIATLTDPAFPRLRVQKLVTIGEALNLGWRLNNAKPDEWPATLPPGDRLAAPFPALLPDLQWRDFWASHDPAPSGRPEPPKSVTVTGADFPRLTAERVYNRLAILEDHGTYWDNDEHFLIPLIREIDVPTGDRGASRFYSDAIESRVRGLRKQRVALLGLWRRNVLALPLLATLAALTITAPGLIPTAGEFTLALLGAIPGSDLLGKALSDLVTFVNTLSFTPALYAVGIVSFQVILFVLLLFVAAPTFVNRLWGDQQKHLRPRLILFAADVAIPIVAVLLLIAIALHPNRLDFAIAAIPLAIAVAVVGGAAFVVGRWGGTIRGYLKDTRDQTDLWTKRNGLISLSSIFLGFLVFVMSILALGVALVLIDSSTAERAHVQRFVLGAIAMLVAFNLLGRVGIWRWDAWDARERKSLRRKPLTRPGRTWPYVLTVLLTVTAVAAAVLVAIGTPTVDSEDFDATTWVAIVVGAIIGLVLLSLGKDIVDNDIAVDAGPAAGSGEGTVSPPPGGPAAGSNPG